MLVEGFVGPIGCPRHLENPFNNAMTALPYDMDSCSFYKMTSALRHVCKGTPLLNFLFSISRTRGFPWTRCTGPRYLRLLHTEISIHGPVLHLNLFLRGPALYQNLLHTDPPVQTLLTRTRGFLWTLSTGPGYLRVIFGFLSRETTEFPGHGFPGMDIIPWIGLLLGSIPTD